MPRYLSIDVLRGAAILLMVQTHFVENLSARDASSAFAWLYDLSQYLGMVPAPLFAFVSGLSFCLWTRRQKTLALRDDMIAKVAIRRGLFLFVLGIAFNFFVWSPDETFNWDILTLIGTALIILAYARKLPAIVLGLVCVMLTLLSPPLRVVADYQAYWDQAEYSYDFTFVDVLAGFLVNGYFPLFPWLIFPFAGFLVGQTACKSPADSLVLGWRLGGLGAGMMLFAGFAATAGSLAPSVIASYYMTDLGEFPATTTFVLAMLGFCLVSLTLLHRWIDRSDADLPSGPTLQFLSRCSAYSLTIYIVHHVLHLWPLWLYGAYRNPDDWQHYWRQAISTPMAFGMALIFVAICYLILMRRDAPWKFNFESLMRWICD